MQLDAETATATENHGCNLRTETSPAKVEPPKEEDERAVCALVHLLQLRDSHGVHDGGQKRQLTVSRRRMGIGSFFFSNEIYSFVVVC